MARSFPLALLIALSGCAAADRVVGLGPASPPPSPTGAFDGGYFGRAELVRARTPDACPASRTGVVEVGDKRLSFAYQPQVIFNPPVKPDGVLHDTVGPAVLDGRIDGERLVMDVVTPDCETRYNLRILHNRS